MSNQQKIIIIEALLRLLGDEILTVQERWNLLAQVVLVLTGENIRDILAHQNSMHKLQLKRGTTDENDAYTGAPGEITMDTETNTLRIHDGTTPGGHPIGTGTDTELPENIDYVVEWQNPTAENNYTWYRKYASGWVEQGGAEIKHGQTVILPVPMADANYTLTAAFLNHTSTSYPQWNQLGYTKTTTSIKLNVNGISQNWRVCGMAQN